MLPIAYRISDDLFCRNCAIARLGSEGADHDWDDQQDDDGISLVMPSYDIDSDVTSFDACQGCREFIRDDWYSRQNRQGRKLIAVYNKRLSALRSFVGADQDGELLPSYAWPGGTPLIYASKYAPSDYICADCANSLVVEYWQAIATATAAYDQDISSADFTDIGRIGDDLPITAMPYQEGADLYCESCNKTIESQYGDPWQDDDDQQDDDQDGDGSEGVIAA